MMFLLAKIVLLLLLAALLGVWLAHWWLRRHFQDVTREYARMDGDWLTWRQALTEKMRHPIVDLSPVMGRIQSLEGAVSATRIPEAKDVDLQPVLARIAGLEQAVKSIQIPTPKEVDLGPVMGRIQSLEGAVSATRIPEPKDVDLQPVHARIADLEQAVKSIQIPAPKDVDLGPVMGRIQSLEGAVDAIRIPEPKDVDLQPVHARIAGLEQAVKSIQIPTPKDVDLGPVMGHIRALESAVNAIHFEPAMDLTDTNRRLEQLDQSVRSIVIPPSTQVDLQPVLDKLDSLEARAAAAPPAAPPRNQLVRAGSRNLLSHAAYGKVDNLQKIKGVKSVLEKMLHGIGVYYFWQIAEWTPADAAHADAQFTAFHGRIARDQWIVQATRLAASEGAAQKPVDL